jgi:adenine deaminase
MERLGRVQQHVDTGAASVSSAASALTAVDLLIHGGRVIDTANGVDRIADVAVAGGLIVAVGADLQKQYAALQTHDATGRKPARNPPPLRVVDGSILTDCLRR